MCVVQAPEPTGLGGARGAGRLFLFVTQGP